MVCRGCPQDTESLARFNNILHAEKLGWCMRFAPIRFSFVYIYINTQNSKVSLWRTAAG